MKIRLIALCAILLVPTLPAAAHSQNSEAQLEKNRQELERIRRERADLQKTMNKLQSSAHSIGDELQNINRQHDVTKRAVSSLDKQLGLITNEVTTASASLVRAEDEAATKRAVLNHRLVEIYKRGPLFYFQALLSADSCTAISCRYLYRAISSPNESAESRA